MKLRVSCEGNRNCERHKEDVWLHIDLEAAPRVGDLARALNLGGIAGLFIDGQHYESNILLENCNLFEGSHISASEAQNTSNSGFSVSLIGGVEAGSRRHLNSKALSIGRGCRADLRIDSPGISSRHLLARLDEKGNPEVLDLDSLNGSWIEDRRLSGWTSVDCGTRIRIGNSFISFEREAHTNPKGFGHIRLFRSANLSPASSASPFISLPYKESGTSHKVPFSWAALLAPIIFGCMMAVVFNPFMALFILMSPMVLIGSWLESKIRGKKSKIQLRKKYKQEIEMLKRAINTQKELEQNQLAGLRINPFGASQRIQSGERLWERNLGSPCFLRLSLGSWDYKWMPEIKRAENKEPLAEAEDILNSLPAFLDFSKDISLRGQILGITGDQHIGDSIARWLVLQAAALHPPGDLEIFYGNRFLPQKWSWLDWLPHNVAHNIGGQNMAGQNNMTDKTEDGRCRLFLVDLFSLFPDGSSAIPLSESSGGILLAPKISDLPDGCTSIIHIKDSSGFAELLEKSSEVNVRCRFRLDGISLAYAKSCSQKLARYRDNESRHTASLPVKINLGELMDAGKLDMEMQIQKWQEQEFSLKVPIGAGQNGKVNLDLARDGPHGLIAGTTGSGKSELLKSLVASLAHHKSPQQINFVLIDYKGGSAFDPCLGLPHIVGMATDLNPKLARRALVSLRAEVTRREEILRANGAEDISHLTKIAHSAALPRLVILIDEFASMAEELPDFISSLVEIARRGRSLGIHLILATQRPAGAIGPNIRANTNFRIGLRVLSDADSQDILDSPLAAQISASTPGRAFLRVGQEEPQIFQTAQTGFSTPIYKKPVEIVKPDRNAENILNDLEKITQAANLAFKKLGYKTPFKPLAEPLPDFLDVEELFPVVEEPLAGDGKGSGLQIGLVDIPEKQILKPLVWNLEEGNLSLSGRKSTEWMVALGILLEKVGVRFYVLDFGGKLKILQQLPRCLGLITGDDSELLNRLLDVLLLDKPLSAEEGSPTETKWVDKENEENQENIVILANNFESLFSQLEASRNYRRIEDINRLLNEGCSRGIHWVMSHTGRSGVKKKAVLQIFTDLRNPNDYVEADIPISAVRAGGDELEADGEFLGGSGKEVRIARAQNPQETIQKLNEGRKNKGRKRLDERQTHKSSRYKKLEPLPSTIPVPSASAVSVPPTITAPASKSSTDKSMTSKSLPLGENLILPFGIVGGRDGSLETAVFNMSKCRHLLIAGPQKSGKSNALLVLALAARRAGVFVVAICSKKSPLFEPPLINPPPFKPSHSNSSHSNPSHSNSSLSPFSSFYGDGSNDDSNNSGIVQIYVETPEELEAETQEIGDTDTGEKYDRGILVLIDDAHKINDSSNILHSLLHTELAKVYVAAAGRNDLLHRCSDLWVNEMRAAKSGLLINPDPLDGDLLGFNLSPEKCEAARLTPGRAVMTGQNRICQIWKALSQ